MPRQDQEPAATVSKSPSAWPADTDIIFPLGGTRDGNRVMLTIQRPLLRLVIHDAIDELRACLIFNDAFPHGILAMSFARHSLNVAAEKHCPAALSISRRLIHDDDYAVKISPVVSSLDSLEF